MLRIDIMGLNIQTRTPGVYQMSIENLQYKNSHKKYILWSPL